MPNPNGALSDMPMGILDPRSQMLLQTGLGLMAAGGPSRLPVSFGSALGQAGTQGLGAYNQAARMGMQNQLLQLQMANAQKPENPFTKINPKDYTPESIAKFSQTKNPADLVPARQMSVGPAGQIFDPYRVQPGTVLPDPNKPFNIGPEGPQPNVPFQNYELKRQKAGATQVNVGQNGIDYGTPPKDMVWARDPSGKVLLEKDKSGYLRPRAVSVAGGPVEMQQEKQVKAEEEKQNQRAKYADVVVTDVDRALNIVEDSAFPVTGVGSMASAVPGTKAHDLSNLLNTIKSNAGFDRLQEMRASSPTGGALGQISEMENKLLQSTIGSVEQSQSKAQFVYNLRRLKDLYLDIVHGPGNRPGEQSTSAPRVRRYNPSTGKIE